MTEVLRYMTGFGSHFSSEAVAGALPEGAQFAAATRLRPLRRASVRKRLHRAAAREPAQLALSDAPDRRSPSLCPLRGREAVRSGTVKEPLAPNRLRWDPPADLPANADFVDGMVTMLANRDPADLEGVAVHLYRASKSMDRRVFVDADGELLIVPQSGTLRIVTELGVLDLSPGMIGLIPRGVRFRVEVDGESRGYVAENHGLPFRLPELGPIGANGLANPRDFETPVAWFEDRDEPTEVVQKYLGRCGRRPSTIRRSTSSPGTAITRPAATSLRASTRSARSASTIPIRRSSPS